MEKLLPVSLTNPQPHSEPAQEILSWSVHQLRRQPQRLPALAAILLGIFAISLCYFHSLGLAALPVLVVLFSLSEFVFPAHYRLTKKSASVRHGLTMLEIQWADVRHAYLTEEGIKLSPLREKNSRFEGLRGVFIRFDDHNKEAVIAAVQRLRQESALLGK